MSTTELSQRLRAMYNEMAKHAPQQKGPLGWDTNLFWEAIAALESPFNVVMSRNYEALYSLLKAGGEALGTCLDMDEEERVGAIFSDAEIVDGREHFIAECSRLKLEWVAPQVQGSSGQGRPDLPSGEPVAWVDPNDGNVISRAVYEDRVPEGRTRYSIPLYRSATEVDRIMEVVREGAEVAKGFVKAGAINPVTAFDALVSNIERRLSRLLSGPSGSGEETQTATLCHRTGQHMFVFAGGEMPDNWRCDCGETTFSEAAASPKLLSQNKPNE